MKSPTQRLLLLIAGVLLIPIVPFILMGSWLEPLIASTLSDPASDASPTLAFASVVGILAIDIILPIPSSAVCTFAGKELGALIGTLACWLGLNLSAGIGYWLGAKFGRPITTRLSDKSTMRKIESFGQRSSFFCLVVCRPLPILAEASVLLMGIRKLPPLSFWPAVMLSNFCIAAAMCLLGAWAAKANMFLQAICISVAVPLLFILFWKARK